MQLPLKQKLGTTTLEIERIRLDGGTQPRKAINEHTAREYGEAMQQSGIGSFEPVIVYFDGTTCWLADGFHRLYGAKLFGMIWIRADIREGTQRDAILYSCGANSKHGLRRTNADKRRAVETLLRDEEWRGWSDRQIAEQCAVDPKTVGNIRRASGVEIPHLRQGVDGKTYHLAIRPKHWCSVCKASVTADHHHFNCEGCLKTFLPEQCHLVEGRWLCNACASRQDKGGESNSAPRGKRARRNISPDQLCLPGFLANG